MKKVIIILEVLCLIIPLALVSGIDADEADQIPKGKIVIYTSIYEDVIKSLDEVLKTRFPKCKIEFVYGGTGQLQARIAAEQAKKKIGCDIVMIAEPAYSLELKEQGLLHYYKSRQADSLAYDYDSKGYWYPVRVSNMILAYNPEKTLENTIPNSFYGFANDLRLRNSIAMSNPLVSGTTMAAVSALKDKYGYEYYEALGKQKVKIESGALALSKLEKGEYKMVMVLEESVLKKQELENSKLAIIYPSDGTINIPSTIMTISNKWSANKNTRSAEIITDWFLGPEGQSAIIAGWMYSVRKDIDAIPHGSIPAFRLLSMPLNWESCFNQKEEVLNKFENLVTLKQ